MSKKNQKVSMATNPALFTMANLAQSWHRILLLVINNTPQMKDTEYNCDNFYMVRSLSH